VKPSILPSSLVGFRHSLKGVLEKDSKRFGSLRFPSDLSILDQRFGDFLDLIVVAHTLLLHRRRVLWELQRESAEEHVDDGYFLDSLLRVNLVLNKPFLPSGALETVINRAVIFGKRVTDPIESLLLVLRKTRGVAVQPLRHSKGLEIFGFESLVGNQERVYLIRVHVPDEQRATPRRIGLLDFHIFSLVRGTY